MLALHLSNRNSANSMRSWNAGFALPFAETLEAGKAISHLFEVVSAGGAAAGRPGTASEVG